MSRSFTDPSGVSLRRSLGGRLWTNSQMQKQEGVLIIES